jgi:hypothetical protein
MLPHTVLTPVDVDAALLRKLGIPHMCAFPAMAETADSRRSMGDPEPQRLRLQDYPDIGFAQSHQQIE